jgi:hypothetical protein
VVPVDAQGRALLYVRNTTDAVIDVMGYFAPAPGAVAAGRFQALEPMRLVDSRLPAAPSNEYSVSSSSGANTALSVPVAGRLGVPASGAAAVVMSMTGVSGTKLTSGFVTAHPGGSSLPAISNLNVNGAVDGGTDRRANLVVVPVGSNGRVDLYLKNVDDVVLDVVGWFTDGSAPASTSGQFTLIAPTREVDTRVPFPFGPLGPNSTASLDPGTVPPGAAGVVQNLTMAPSAAAGYLTAFPFGGAPPLVSNLNATTGGQVRAALAITKLSGGRESFYSFRGMQLAVDVFGYFS